MVILLLKLFCSLVITSLAAFTYGKFLLLSVYVAVEGQIRKDEGFQKDEEEKSMICRENVCHVLVCLSVAIKIQGSFLIWVCFPVMHGNSHSI